MHSAEERVSSPKDVKGLDIDLPLSGKLAELDWVKVSRKAPPSEMAASGGDIVYNVETPVDIGRAARRQIVRK